MFHQFRLLNIKIKPLSLIISLLLSVLGFSQVSAEELQVARVFGSGMVLQSDAPLKVWGTAPQGQKVSVTLGKELRETEADAQGEWSVELTPQKASAKPVTLSVNTLEYSDILFGEVWICAGQSNMKFSLGAAQVEESLRAQAGNNQLRYLKHVGLPLIAKTGYTKEQLARCNTERFFERKWEVSTRRSARKASAVGWIFGNGLQRELEVPVGIIQLAVGGSAMNNWIAPERARTHPVTASLYEQDWLSNEEVFAAHRKRGKDAMQAMRKEGEPYLIGKTPYRWLCEPGFLFEAGVAPLKGLSFKGIVWYQGESDTWQSASITKELFPLMVESWRSYLGREDCPFIYVQLPGYQEAEWPAFREVQKLAEKVIPNSAMAVTIDLGKKDDIHPKDKQPIGERVLGLALKQAYGKEVLGFPQCTEATVNGRDLVLKFTECGTGFQPVEGNVPGFEVAEAEGTFTAVSAQITAPNTITVAIPASVKPTQLRYGWVPFPEPALLLFNSEKLPVGPFLMPLK